MLLGRRGWTVKHIQDAAGARVDIDQTVSPRKIVVSGSDERAVKSAVQMVRDVLKYPHAVEGEQKDGQLSLDDALAAAAPVDLSAHLALQAQAQAQAMGALLAQQQQQQQQRAAGQASASQQAALANNVLGGPSILGTTDAAAAPSRATRTSSFAFPIFLYPRQVPRAATTGPGVPSYASMNGGVQQRGRMPPQSNLIWNGTCPEV